MPARTFLADRDDLSAMVLLHDVVEVLHLPHDDWRGACAIDPIHGRLVGAALAHRDRLGNTAGLHGFIKKAQGCGFVALGRQQEVERFAFLVYRTVEVSPGTFELDVSLVHAPAAAHRAFVLAEHFSKQGQKPDRPAVDPRVVDKHTAFLHHLLKMAVAQRISRVPTDANQNHVDWEARSFGSQPRVQAFLFKQLVAGFDQFYLIDTWRKRTAANDRVCGARLRRHVGAVS